MTSSRASARRAPDPWVWGLLALLAGLAITAGLARREWHREALEHRQAFDARLDDVEASLRSELRTCELVVRAMQSLYLASDEVTDAEFRAAFDNLGVASRLPSLQGLSFAERVTGPGRDRYVVRHVQPDTSANRSLEGFDISVQPASLAAVELSRDSDGIVMSAPFFLRQSQQAATPASGMVMRLPVYRSGQVPVSTAERRMRVRGSLGASFMLPTLIATALRGIDTAGLEVSVRDITDAAPVLLHRAGAVDGKNAIRGRRDIRFGDRTWRIDIADAPMRSGHQAAWLLTLLSGGLSSLLLGALAWSVVGARRRAIDLAKAVGARYRHSEARFRRLNELLPTLVLLVDRDTGTVTYANKVARERLGIGKAGAALSTLASPDLQETLHETGPGQRWSGEALLKGKTGEFWASILASGIDLDDQANWLMVATDVSEQRRLTERLSFQASHDALTRLPNRQAFETEVKALLASPDDQLHCLLFIDLDQFKLINDTSGHIAGDQMLVQLVLEMRQQLRKEDVLARLGGDEFGVLLPEIGDAATAAAAAERLRNTIDGHVFLWKQRSYIISASIGGVVFRCGDAKLQELMAQADTACYTAKDAGRNRVRFYSDDAAASLIRRSEMDWAHRIRWALDESRLLLAYQELRPIDAADREAGSIELLLRLRNEEGALVLPGAFMPAAERYGLTPRIDRWVVETALANLDRLHPLGAALQLCSINLSAASLQDEGFADYLLQAIERHGVSPHRLMFEITETAAMRDLMQAAALVARLRKAGCRVALDDFGAGMSSFGYLKYLGVDTIKIDGAFVADIEHEKVSHSIVRAITEIGHQHGLAVVAEWVAGPSQVEVLARLGVDMVQGFGIHAPEIASFQR